MNKKPLIILTGPTAVGKTKLSIDIAKKLNGEIISADSMQVYKQMDIGTAKIKKEEMDGIKHYLIDEFEPDEEFNVVVFQKLAKKYIKEIYGKGKVPIIVGGTGFYIQSVLYDIDFTDNEQDNSYREELSKIAIEKGNEYVHNMLKEIDPVSASNIHCNNLKRVIRAIEYYKLTGEKISEHNEQQSANESPYEYRYFVLNDVRETLYERINKRIDMMFEDGLIEEVSQLYKKGYDRNLVSMQGLGYKELIAYLENEISLDEAKYILKRDTRHFAKRQLTWFRREKDVMMVNKNEFNYDDNKILNYIVKECMNMLFCDC